MSQKKLVLIGLLSAVLLLSATGKLSDSSVKDYYKDFIQSETREMNQNEKELIVQEVIEKQVDEGIIKNDEADTTRQMLEKYL